MKMNENSMLPYSEEAIRKVIKSCMNYEKSICIFAMQEHDIHMLITHLRCERTILFHLGEVEYVFYPRCRKAVLFPCYLYSRKEYEALVLQLTAIVQKIRDQMCTFPTMIERELHIHDALCTKVTYADDGDESHSIVGPLIYRRGVCDGFSKAAKVLLQECGINSHVILGTANSKGEKYEPHAWNIVKIDNSWYHLDITFDKTVSVINQRYDYFNIPTKEIIKDHIIDSLRVEISNVNCENCDDYYERSGVFFSTLQSLETYLKYQLTKKTKYLQIRVSDKVKESDILKTFKLSLNALKCDCQYRQSINPSRNIYEWEFDY